MTLAFPSDEWIKQLSDQLNASPSYERSAKDWEGDFCFVVQPDQAYADTAYLYLALYHGKSPDAALIDSIEGRPVEFVISAPYGTWRQVIEGKLDPIQGMMMGRLKLKGDLKKIMRYPRAAKEIVSCCAQVSTRWG